VVERRIKRVGCNGLSSAALSRWEFGGFLLTLGVGCLTMISVGPVLDVVRNVFIVLLAYWAVFALVNSFVARLQTKRARLVERREWILRMADSGRSLPWHPAQGPPLDTAVRTWRPYELGPELPSLN